MIDISLSDALELKKCKQALEHMLKHLDEIGAGIAAIHVCAAIDSLSHNIEKLHEPENKHSVDESLLHVDTSKSLH